MCTSDAECIMAIAGGDERAFEQLMSGWELGVRRWFQRNGKVSADMAEDLKQEVFLKIWRKAGTFRPEYHVAAWICQIARNTLRDYYRKSSRRVDRVSEKSDVSENSLADRGVDSFLAVECRDMVDAMLLQCECSERPFLVSMINAVRSGLDKEQMADLMGVSVSCILWRYAELLKYLRESRQTVDAF